MQTDLMKGSYCNEIHEIRIIPFRVFSVFRGLTVRLSVSSAFKPYLPLSSVIKQGLLGDQTLPEGGIGDPALQFFAEDLSVAAVGFVGR